MEEDIEYLAEGYGYIRVSTDEQKKKGYSVVEQKELLIKWGSENRIRIVKFFIDDGYSATNVDRPDFQRMLSELSKPTNTVKIVACIDTSRLIRNLILKKSIHKLFEKLKVKLFYLQAFVDESTVEGTMVNDIYAIMDETELRKVSPRTFRGLRGSALHGNYSLGGPQPPRGYKKVKNEKFGKGSILVINEEEKDWIITIFTMMATNRITREQMIKYLRKNKVFNIVWDRRSLDAIMDNTIYYGRLKTSYFDSEEPDILDEYKTFWYSLDCHTIPIITKELWMEANHAYHHYKKAMKHKYVFARMVYSVDSDDWMTCEPAWKKRKNDKILYKYYIDNKTKKRINEKKVIEKFALEYTIKQLDEINVKTRSSLEKIVNNKKRRREMLDEDFDNGFISESDYREEIRKINISIQETKNRIKNLDAKSENFLELPFDKQRAIALAYIKRINISFINDTITFEYLK